MPSQRKKSIPSFPSPQALDQASRASSVNTSSSNYRPSSLARAATRRLDCTNRGPICKLRNFRFPAPGSPSTSQRKKNCLIPQTSRLPSTAFPVNASSQLDNMNYSPKARVLSNQCLPSDLLNGMVSSPKTRLVSTHEFSQRITPGLFNSLVSSPTSHEGSRRVTPGLLAIRTLPNLAFSPYSNANANLLSPSPGKKSCNNIQPPLNQLTSLDKRRKSMVPSGSR